jgi:hypothetical protein
MAALQTENGWLGERKIERHPLVERERERAPLYTPLIPREHAPKYISMGAAVEHCHVDDFISGEIYCVK